MQSGEPDDERAAEAVVYITFLLIFQQLLLECIHSFVSLKLEHVDKLVEVESHAAGGGVDGAADARFLKIEGLGIVEPVLHRIAVIVRRCDLHFFEVGGGYV